jgi:hypothetical protein
MITTTCQSSEALTRSAQSRDGIDAQAFHNAWPRTCPSTAALAYVRANGVVVCRGTLSV